MPGGQGKVKPRSVRIPDDEWAAALDAVALRGETVTDVVRRALRRYVAETARRPR